MKIVLAGLFLLLIAATNGTGTLTLETPAPYHYGEPLTFAYSLPHTYRAPDFVVWCWNGVMGPYTDADYISEKFLSQNRGTVSVIVDAAHSASNYPWAVLDETQPASCSAVVTNDVQKQGRGAITNQVLFDMGP